MFYLAEDSSRFPSPRTSIMTTIASHIDYTLLGSETTIGDIERLCTEAVEHKFASICIPNYFVKHARRFLDGLQEEMVLGEVKIGTVAGYPLGFSTTAAKVEEIRRASIDGADEVDFVVPIPAVINGNFNFVKQDLESCITTARLYHLTSKVIFETDLFDATDIEKLCHICQDIEPNFVKTSTGYRGGADVKTVRFLKNHLPDSIKIKASGGIQTHQQAVDLIEAGATRLGTSNAMKLLVST